VVLDIIPSFYSVFILFFPLVSIFSFTPFVWKKNSAFGVMLPEEFKSNKQLAIMSRKYTLFAIVAGACLSLTCVVVQHNSVTIFCAVVYVILCLAMFVMNNRLVRNIIAVNDYENMQKPVFMQSVTEEFKIKTISIWWLAVLLIPVAISFYDAYKKLANLVNKNIWECKIGRTEVDPIQRVLSQTGTCYPELPHLALIIHCDDSAKLEAALHSILKYKDRWLKNAPGNEWFLTSPFEIEELYNGLLEKGN